MSQTQNIPPAGPNKTAKSGPATRVIESEIKMPIIQGTSGREADEEVNLDERAYEIRADEGRVDRNDKI